MKKLFILVLCGGCTFGMDDRTTDTLDQGGVRVTPIRIDIDNGSESVGIDDVQFRNVTDIFSGDGPEMVIEFGYEGHTIEFDANYVERLTVAGGQTWVRVDGTPQVVEVTSSVAVEDGNFVPRSSRLVDLRFAFRPELNAAPVLTVVAVEAVFHCPPFDTRPAEVEDEPVPTL